MGGLFDFRLYFDGPRISATPGGTLTHRLGYRKGQIRAAVPHFRGLPHINLTHDEAPRGD
jgi:hypothetical protein